MMINPRIIKTVSLILVVLLSTSYLFSQYDVIYGSEEQSTEDLARNQSQKGTAAQGMIDGQRDAKGNMLYGCGGFACGVFGFLLAAVSDPQPNPTHIASLTETKGSEYAMSYRAAYSKKAKNQNMLYAGIGWVVGTTASLIMLYSGDTGSTSYKHK